jgi:hypothetical protein
MGGMYHRAVLVRTGFTATDDMTTIALFFRDAMRAGRSLPLRLRTGLSGRAMRHTLAVFLFIVARAMPGFD